MMDNIVHFLLLTVWASLVSTRTIHVIRMFSGLDQYQKSYPATRLPYKYDAFEPWLDAKTLEEHHTGVHAGRIKEMNHLLQEWRWSGDNPELSKSSILKILENINKVPLRWREPLRNNIGGYLNHIFFFATLTPNPKDEERNMSVTMKGVFMRSFHNVPLFKKRFNETAKQIFSNGYVWLVREPEKRYLTIFAGTDENNPISSHKMQPILGLDLWEHSYFTKYGINREEYIRNWWKLVDFDKVEAILDWWWSLDPQEHGEL